MTPHPCATQGQAPKLKIAAVNTSRRIALASLLLGASLLSACGNDAAPASTFVLLDGSSQTTADLKGKVTLVNFWATSCTTCVAEMPDIVATYDKFKARSEEHTSELQSQR